MSSPIPWRSALFTLAALALAGCSTISKEECQAIDWRTDEVPETRTTNG